MSTIRAIYFDLGDTLVERDPAEDEESIKLIYKILGDPIPLDVDFPRLRQRMKAIERATWNSYKPQDLLQIETLEAEMAFLRNSFYPSVLERWGVNNPPQYLLNTLATKQIGPKTFRCFHDVEDTLARLKGLGLLLGCVSNALPSAEGILQHLELWDRFDCLMLSYRTDCRCLKPNHGIHRKALKCLSIMGGDAVFIDDRPGFVNKARKIYKCSILIDRDNNYPNETGNKIEQLDKIFEKLEDAHITAGPLGISFNQLPLFSNVMLSLCMRSTLASALRFLP